MKGAVPTPHACGIPGAPMRASLLAPPTQPEAILGDTGRMRIITRGARIGPCNICGITQALTEDHIPPKGVSRLSQVVMLNLTDLLGVERPKKSGRISQNGVKFRTLCAKCNNERLGIHYDPTLISFTREIRSYLESALHLPPTMYVPSKVNRLVRSVVGHLLAHGVGEHRAGTMMDELTNYFLDESAAFPAGLKLYYWIYPYNDQVLVKGAGLSLHYWNAFAVFSLLKFYPLSFFFVLDEPPEWCIPYERLDPLLSSAIEDEAMVRISFRGLPVQRWPEAPVDTGTVLHCPGAMGAVPRVP